MKFILYLDNASEWRWNLKASNGNIIADSGEGYRNKADALHGINLVMSTNGAIPIYE